MSEVKIKNVTVVVDGQEYSFSGRSVAIETAYDPAKDPEVQGSGLSDVAPANETSTPSSVEGAPSAETPTEPVTASQPTDTNATAQASVTSTNSADLPTNAATV